MSRYTIIYRFRTHWCSRILLFQDFRFDSRTVFLHLGVRVTVIFNDIMKPWPNKSPEPTAVGAVSSAVAVHAAIRRRLSFFR